VKKTKPEALPTVEKLAAQSLDNNLPAIQDGTFIEVNTLADRKRA